MQPNLGFLTWLDARRIIGLVLLMALVGALIGFGWVAFNSSIGMHSWLTAQQVWKTKRHRYVQCARTMAQQADPAAMNPCAKDLAHFDAHLRLRDSVARRDWEAAHRNIEAAGLQRAEADAATSLLVLADYIPPADEARDAWKSAVAGLTELRRRANAYRDDLRHGRVSAVERRNYLEQVHRLDLAVLKDEDHFAALMHESAPVARYLAVSSVVGALLILVGIGAYLGRVARRFQQRNTRVERRLERHEAKMVELDRMVAVGTLAAGVGHEINNPLTYVAGGLDYALMVLREMSEADEAVDDEFKERLAEAVEALEDARTGTDRVSDIASDLRTFARHERVEPVEPVALAPILDLALDMADHKIRHAARLERDYAGDVRAMANESRLAQVFLNLIVNAAQAIQTGEVEDNQIRVVTRRAGDEVVVEVHDTGQGIPAEERKLVFEPFQTTKPEGEGTGLGMAISRNIVDTLGGSLTFESTPGEQTVFEVRLPAASTSGPTD